MDKTQEDKEEGAVAFCEDHIKKITKEIWEVPLRRLYLKVAGNLFAIYLDGKGHTLNNILDIIDEGSRLCPACYWDSLGASTYYFLETVMGVAIPHGPSNGDEQKRIITDVQ